MVEETIKQTGERHGVVTRVAVQLGLGSETLRHWVKQVAPSTYYAAVSRPPSARRLEDEQLKMEITRTYQDNFDVYGVEKVWKHLRGEGIEVGRDRVARLMAELELVGAVRGKTWRTTVPGELERRPADLVERNFTASMPNRLWVADLTYVSTWSGPAYVAFVTDVFSRYIVGWKVSISRLDRPPPFRVVVLRA